MELLVKSLVCFLAGAGAGIGTGFAGMSAAAIANRVVGMVMILTSIVILLVNYVF